MSQIKETNIKTSIYYFFDDISSIKNFDPNQIKIDKKSYKNIIDCMFLSFHVRISEWNHTLYLSECQGTPCSKQTQYPKFKWL